MGKYPDLFYKFNYSNYGAPQETISSQTPLEKLALRVLDKNYPGQTSTPPKLFTEEIPQHLRREIYVPNKTEIIGSLVYDSKSIIVLNTKLVLEKVFNNYFNILDSRGWELLRRDRAMAGGFLSAEIKNYLKYNRIFSRKKDGVHLTILAKPRPDNTIDLFLTYLEKSNKSSSFQMSGTMPARPLPTWRMQRSTNNLIPPLFAPEGARSNYSGTSVSPDNRNLFAKLTTELSADEILSHYATQLEDADWQPLSYGKCDRAVWQTCSLKDPNQEFRHALLSIVEIPDESDERMLLLNLY